MNIPYIGLSGVAGAGKDTVFDRLVEIGGERFQRLSVADPLKESVAALLNVSVAWLEEAKRDGVIGVQVVHEHRGGLDSPMPMRKFLQRYGTEAHRNVFGDDFWLDEWAHRAKLIHIRHKPCTVVNTSVRFVNEAELIIELGGEVWHVEGPQDEGAGGHESEVELPAHLITHRIDNTVRQIAGKNGNRSGQVGLAPDYDHLDDQIATLLHGGTLG